MRPRTGIHRLRRGLWGVASAAVLIGGCAKLAALGPSPEEQAVRNYYERHASEEWGRCHAPLMDGISDVQVVEETADRLVLDVRYFYRDWLNDNRRAALRECRGFGRRQFVLKKDADRFEVVSMSDPLPR